MTKHIDNLKQIVGDPNALDREEEIHPFLEDWRGQIKGSTPLILFPENTDDVQKIVRYCHQNDIKIVSQGGNTSLCGANVPNSSNERLEIVINTSKMNKVLEVDSFNQSIIVESGCILQNIQNTAEDHGLLFPLSLSAEGTCQIGGNVSTNAGGVNVLKYGMARDQVMGIEAVLPDGSILTDLKSLNISILVKEGYEADLVILNDNPISKISSTQKINAVIKSGKYFDRKSLDFLMYK